MTCRLLAVGLVALTAPALADLQIFFTSSAQPWGLDDAGNAFLPTAGEGRDVTSGAYHVSHFPPPSYAYDTPVNIDPGAGEFVWIWARFLGEPNLTHVQRMYLDWARYVGGVKDATWAPALVNYYVVDDSAGGVGQARWNGVGGFQQEPQLLEAPVAYGIRNVSGTGADWNLYAGGTFRTALLGAMRVNAGYAPCPAYTGADICYAFVPDGENPNLRFGGFGTVPEPVSLALLALAGGLGRRR